MSQAVDNASVSLCTSYVERGAFHRHQRFTGTGSRRSRGYAEGICSSSERLGVVEVNVGIAMHNTHRPEAHCYSLVGMLLHNSQRWDRNAGVLLHNSQRWDRNAGVLLHTSQRWDRNAQYT